jgi:hypothetical protein
MRGTEGERGGSRTSFNECVWSTRISHSSASNINGRFPPENPSITLDTQGRNQALTS